MSGIVCLPPCSMCSCNKGYLNVLLVSSLLRVRAPRRRIPFHRPSPSGAPLLRVRRGVLQARAATAWDDATLNKLFWLGANHHRPVDLPDTTGLSWREGVFRCLGSVRARARTSLPSFAPPASPLPFAAHSLPPFAAHASPPP